MKCGGWKPAWLNEQVFNLVDIIHCPRGGNWVSIFPHKNRKSPRNGYRHISLSSSFLTPPGRASVSFCLRKKKMNCYPFLSPVMKTYLFSFEHCSEPEWSWISTHTVQYHCFFCHLYTQIKHLKFPNFVVIT